MPQYQLPNAQTVSDYFAKVNKKLKNDFINYSDPDDERRLLVPEKKLGLLYYTIDDVAALEHAKVIHLTKKTVYSKFTATGRTVDLSIVNEDGMFDTLVWTTTPTHIQTALRNGVFPAHVFQHPVPKMIAQLGEFKRHVFKQSVENNLIVKHNAGKLQITDCIQDQLEGLLPLCNLINNYEESLSPKENLAVLEKELLKIINKFKAIKVEKLRGTSPLVVTLKKNIQEQIDLCHSYYRNLEKLANASIPVTEQDVKNILTPYVNPFIKHNLSLQNFLQVQLNTLINNAIEVNYQVSGFLQDSSLLQRILIKTQIIAEGFSSQKIDYHNPVTPAHALNFHGLAKNNNVVILDLGELGFAPWSRAELLEQVALLECIDDEKRLLNSVDQERGYFGINWGGNVSTGLTWLGNFVKDILGTILDLAYIVGKGISDAAFYISGIETQPVQFPSGYSWLLKTDLAENKYAKLEVNKQITDKFTKIRHYSILEGLYVGVGRIFSRLLIEPLVSISDVVATEVLQLKTTKQIIYDATFGVQEVNESAVAELINQRLLEMKVNEASNAVTQAALVASFNKTAGTSQVASYAEIHDNLEQINLGKPPVADLPYSLNPDDPADLVNWFIDDFVRGLVEVFSHNSLRDHPIAGLALTLAASTATPMVFSDLLKFPMLNSINQNISVPMAQYLIGDTTGLMAGFSVGVFQGQMTFLAVEIFNGRNSIAADGLKTLLENPVIATVVTLTAVSFGYALAYEMQIPVLSEFIMSETDQATFPWFELGIAGAKIAAILIEGTFSLHQEHNHHGEQHVTKAIDKLRPEIKEALTLAYCRKNNLVATDLRNGDLETIDLSVNDYCNNIHVALQKPHIAEQLQQLVNAVTTVQGRDISATDLESQNKLFKFLEKRDLRQQILRLNPAMLTFRDKHIILGYLTQVYPDDIDYVAAVRVHFENEQKMGPFSGTFKIIFNYPAAVVRSLLGSMHSLVYDFSGIYYRLVKNNDTAKAMHDAANRARQPVRDLNRKIKNDLGLLVKGLASSFRITWGLFGAILMMPVTILFSLPAMLFVTNAPLKIFTYFNKIFFAPGRVSQLINTIVAVLRADAGAKNLVLATQNIDTRYSRIAFVPGATAKSEPNTGSSSIAPAVPAIILTGADLERKVIELITVAFRKRNSLVPLVNPQPHTLEMFFPYLQLEVQKVRQVESLYSKLTRGKPQFSTDLKAALFEVTDAIMQSPQIGVADKLFYKEKFINLLQSNSRKPIAELQKAYADFMNVNLPATVSQKLDPLLAKLRAAQTALKNLSDNTGIPNQQRVANCLREHECLGLQSMSEIENLKRNLAESRWLDQHQQATGTQLLHALELIHNAAQLAVFRLSAYSYIVESLTKLPKPVAVSEAKVEAITPKQPVTTTAVADTNLKLSMR